LRIMAVLSSLGGCQDSLVRRRRGVVASWLDS
jgi:hypothetical protein